MSAEKHFARRAAYEGVFLAIVAVTGGGRRSISARRLETTRSSADIRSLVAWLALVVVLGWPRVAPGYVAFVDNSAVDLSWRPEADCVRQEIRYRDGATIANLGPTDSFYRIDGLAKGQPYEFEVCCWREYGHSCPIVQVTTGQVHGILYRDREWSSGEYALYGSVFVEQGAALTIGGVSVMVGPRSVGSASSARTPTRSPASGSAPAA